MDKYIIRINSSSEIEQLLSADTDIEIVTPLEHFDQNEDDESIKDFEIYVENALDVIQKKGILKDIEEGIKENENGKSNDKESERDQGQTDIHPR